jgi:hypothetical protein
MKTGWKRLPLQQLHSYLRSCASNDVVVRAPSSHVGVYVQLRGMQEAVRRENSIPRDYVQRIHEERLPDVNSLRPVKSAWRSTSLPFAPVRPQDWWKSSISSKQFLDVV